MRIAKREYRIEDDSDFGEVSGSSSLSDDSENSENFRSRSRNQRPRLPYKIWFLLRGVFDHIKVLYSYSSLIRRVREASINLEKALGLVKPASSYVSKHDLAFVRSIIQRWNKKKAENLTPNEYICLRLAQAITRRRKQLHPQSRAFSSNIESPEKAGRPDETVMTLNSAFQEANTASDAAQIHWSSTPDDKFTATKLTIKLAANIPPVPIIVGDTLFCPYCKRRLPIPSIKLDDFWE